MDRPQPAGEYVRPRPPLTPISDEVKAVDRAAAADAIDTARQGLREAMVALDHVGDTEPHRHLTMAVAAIDDARTAMVR